MEFTDLDLFVYCFGLAFDKFSFKQLSFLLELNSLFLNREKLIFCRSSSDLVNLLKSFVMLFVEFSDFIHLSFMGLDVLLDDDFVFVDEFLFVFLLFLLCGKCLFKLEEFILGIETVKINSTDLVFDVFHFNLQLFLLLSGLKNLLYDLLGHFLLCLKSWKHDQNLIGLRFDFCMKSHNVFLNDSHVSFDISLVILNLFNVLLGLFTGFD